jgi:nucleotidyltransferase/DNA polymerase involved in DNA repair
VIFTLTEKPKSEIIAELRKVPGIGENAAEALYRLGIRHVDDLKGKSPEQMYEELRNMKDYYAEPCMLNSLKIATKFASSKK